MYLKSVWCSLAAVKIHFKRAGETAFLSLRGRAGGGRRGCDGEHGGWACWVAPGQVVCGGREGTRFFTLQCDVDRC